MTRWIVLPICLLLLSVVMLSCSGRGPDTRAVRAVSSTDAAPAPSTSPPPSTTTTTTPTPPATAPRATARATARSAPTPRTTVSTAPIEHGQSLGTFVATCYGAFEGYGGGTASGQQSGRGSIATDPRVIPMGTHLAVEGYGPGVANDVGGAIKGYRIDVWMQTAAECSAWGTRSVEVWAQ